MLLLRMYFCKRLPAAVSGKQVPFTFFLKKKPIELQFIADDIFNFDIAFSYANLALSFAS